MKRIALLLLLLLGVTGSSLGVSYATAPPPRAVPLNRSAAPVSMFAQAESQPVYLTDRYGQVVPVAVSASHPLIAAATWCPHCHDLIAFLNDPEIQPYLKDKQLNFVYKDEWPRVEAQFRQQLPELMMQQGIPAEQLETVFANTMSRMKREAQNMPVLRPSELAKIPGNYYFITEASKSRSPLKVKGFPTVYKPETGNFDGSAMEWVKENTSIPADLRLQKGKQYSLYQ